MVQSVLVFYRALDTKAARLLRESTLHSDSVYIDGIGVQETMEPCIIDRAGGTDGYLLMYFADPVLVLDRAGTNWHPPGRLVLWHPKDAHYYGNEGQPWNHSWIHLCGEDVPSLLERDPIPSNRLVPFSFPELFDESLLGIYEELEGLWPADGVLIRNLVENLFRRLRRALSNDPTRSPMSERMRAVKRHIDTHYNEPFTLKDLARVGRLSVSHLCAEFRTCFGCPPIEYRTRLRLQQACHFLRDKNLRISEIAAMVGYSDVYYFSRHFKQRYGTCPRELRKRITKVSGVAQQ
jgi:AraC-like DNA-binding protein